jgi:hypothetical protein
MVHLVVPALQASRRGGGRPRPGRQPHCASRLSCASGAARWAARRVRMSLLIPGGSERLPAHMTWSLQSLPKEHSTAAALLLPGLAYSASRQFLGQGPPATNHPHSTQPAMKQNNVESFAFLLDAQASRAGSTAWTTSRSASGTARLHQRLPAGGPLRPSHGRHSMFIYELPRPFHSPGGSSSPASFPVPSIHLRARSAWRSWRCSTMRRPRAAPGRGCTGGW